jgi:hypothetical protein
MFYFTGINVFPLDSSLKFPLDYAKEHSHQQIAKVLEEAKGKFYWKQLKKWSTFLSHHIGVQLEGTENEGLNIGGHRWRKRHHWIDTNNRSTEKNID